MAEPDDTSPLSALTGGPRKRRFRLAGWPLALVLVWVTLAVLDIVVIAPFGAASQSSANASRQAGGGHRQAGAGGRAGHAGHRLHGHRQHGRHHHGSTPAPSPSPSATPKLLDPVSASAFGPTGVSSGDNPSGAPEAIDASMTTAWRSQWYATAEFGSLKTGTGLLLDMGRAVSVHSVRILLDKGAGADLTLYTGATPVLADERMQASASDVGGTVHLALARPERARYLVIWFTLLPPDPAGTYQVAIYNVQIKGTVARTPGT
jgi:hypothetical protein